jgi:hypothetical protein
MKVGNLISLVRDRLSGVTTPDDRKWHEETIRQYLSRAYNQLLCELSASGFRNLSLFAKLYGSDNSISVIQDNNTKIYYSVLPVDISPLPNMMSGILNISPVEGQNVGFYPMERSDIPTYTNTLFSRVSGEIGYTVGVDNSGRITVDYFNMNGDNAISHVKMYLIRPFEDYDDDEQIHIPAGQDEKMIESVVNFAIGTPVKDLKNSGSEIKN